MNKHCASVSRFAVIPQQGVPQQGEPGRARGERRRGRPRERRDFPHSCQWTTPRIAHEAEETEQQRAEMLTRAKLRRTLVKNKKEKR